MSIDYTRNHIYVAIDLKSFYASVECADRGLDPLTTNLVVADTSRTDKTICLAVSPSLKAYGISGRARLFEVVKAVKDINNLRKSKIKDGIFKGKSYFSTELAKHADYELEYIAAPPRMSRYIEYSTKIYDIYLKYVAPEDMHIYSVDEVFIDVTHYLTNYKMTAYELAMTMIKDVLKTTGITATAGIGTNMYLCKIAMDIVAKHAEPDRDGVRIAEIDEMSYRKLLWNHRPLTDFWRVGRGYARKLESIGIFTMGDIARCSVSNEEILYNLFGVNAELLIDHAWGYEPCTIEMVKKYRPSNNSFSSGQVLMCPYTFEKARIVVQEMADAVSLNLLEKKMVTNQLVLTVGYDIENLKDPDISEKYKGEITKDYMGRLIPRHAHGTTNLDNYSSSSKLIIEAVLNLYDKIVNRQLLIRRITIATNHVIMAKDVDVPSSDYEQMDLFSDFGLDMKQTDYNSNKDKLSITYDKEAVEKDIKIQEALLTIKKKYGKNAILKGISLTEGATGKDRNEQIGGHKA